MEGDVQKYAELARKLTQCVEAGDSAGIETLIDELAHARETELFFELGRLTRELHESLKTFKMDSRVFELAESEIPDARDRLNYVIAMTEQAAHRTLNEIEDSMSLIGSITDRSRELQENWMRFRRRDMAVDEFRAYSRELDDFFEQVGTQGGAVHAKLTEALMAQDYQDLTGQIIRRVINLVQEVEESLIDLVRISGARMSDENRNAADNKTKAQETATPSAGQGPHIPGSDDDEQFVQDQDAVDDLLSNLGF